MNPKLKDALIIGAVLMLAFVAWNWHTSDVALHEAQARSDALKQTVQDAQAVIAQKSQDQAKTNADLKAQLDAIARERQQVPTPQQVVVDVSKLVPNLPRPLEVKQEPATATEPARQSIVVPQEDIPALHDYRLTCDENAVKLNACALNLAAEQTKFDAQGTELKATSEDRDNWKRTAKGGSFWRRTWTATKWVAIGAAAGYVAERMQK